MGRITTSGLLLAGCITGAAAQTTTPQVVEIIGSTPLGGAQDSLSVPGPVQRAGDADLQRSQALDLSEFMNRRFGSVTLNELQGNPLQADLNYRGFTASPLLGTPQGLSVYLDGVRINQPFGDVVSWDLVPRRALAQVTLLGGSNPLFGLNTLGGALVLESKNGRDNPGGSAAVTLGSAGRRIVDLDYGLALSERFDLYLNGSVFKEDGWRDYSPSDQKQLFGKLGWRSGPTKLALTLAHARTELLGNGLQEETALAQRWESVFTRPDQTNNRSTLAALNATHEISNTLSLAGQVYARRLRSRTLNGDLNDDALDQNIYFNPTAGNVAALTDAGYTGMPTAPENAGNTAFPYWACLLNVVDDDEPFEKCTGLLNRSATQQSAWGLAGQLNFKGTLGGVQHQATVGGGYDASRVHFTQGSEFGYVIADRSVVGTGAFADGHATDDDGEVIDSRVDLNSRSRTLSVYASDTMALAPGLDLTLAGRWNRTTVKMVDQLDPEGTTGTLNGEHRFSRFNPAVGLTARVAPGVGVYGGASQGSRTPTATELGCADPEDPCRLPNAMASDPPLKPVVTRTLEAGVRGRSDAWRWNVGVFRADNRDDILFVASDVAGTGYFRNFGKTRRQGLEAGVSWRGGAWELGTNLTWLDATFRSDETLLGGSNSSNEMAEAGFPGIAEDATIHIESGNKIPMTPRGTLKAFVQWQVMPRFGIGLDAIAVAGSHARGDENNEHEPDGVLYRGSGRAAGYGLLNATASWQIVPRLELSLKVNNVFDRRYSSGAVLGATPFDDQGRLQSRQAGSYPAPEGGTLYAVRQTTFQAPGAPRQASVELRWSFE